MTLLEVKSEIYKYILKDNDTINIKQFVLDIGWVANDPEERDAIIRKCLDDLTTSGFLSYIKYGDTEQWILNAPLITRDQTLEIPGDLAVAIATLSNDILKSSNRTKRLADPLNIKSEDLFVILETAQICYEQILKKEEKEEE